MMNPFILPLDRAELLKKLSAKMAPHGGMMPGTMKPPADPPDPQAVWKGLRPTEGQPLVIYVHVPFCISRCSFCGFYRNQTDDEAIAAYVDRLLVEIDRTADEGVFTTRPVNVVYFGGGTPTALTADQLRRVIGRLHERFNIASDCEFTIEGRLFAFDDDRVRACLETGVNRFSFGVQSFETELRRSLGRRLSREETITRLAQIKDICQDKICLVADLIYGLPGQTQEDWMERNVKTTHLESALDGVDLYSLKVFPGSPIAKRVEREGNWTEEDRLARHTEASDYLESVGWTQLSTTHWGRNKLERNMYNTYAKIGVDMVPFGCGAGGFIGDWSIMQEMDLAKYMAAVDEGEKPIGMITQSPPVRRDSIRFTRQTDLGYFDPAQIPETDFTPILKNWEEAGVWSPDVRTSASGNSSAMRFTRLGEFYQTKLNSLLTGFHMAAHATLSDKLKMGAAIMKKVLTK